MISKKVKIRGLPKLGKILDFRPPLSVPEVGEFKDRFETQLLRLLEQDDLAVNQTTLSPRRFSPRDQFRQLGTYDSDCLEVDDLVRGLLPIWGFLKLEEYVSYDSDDLIAKILELVVLIRRKGKAKAFGSGSKNDPDKIYKPSNKISKMLESLLEHAGETQLPEAIKIQLLEAHGSFKVYHSSLKKLEAVYVSDEAKFKSIYKALTRMLNDKGLATQLINSLISDIQGLGFLVERKFADGSWTKKLKKKEVYLANKRP